MIHCLFLFYLTHWYLYSLFFFFFNDTATTEIYTLSLHDALPISNCVLLLSVTTPAPVPKVTGTISLKSRAGDRKSTRLNSSHQIISYAVFCLKKKKINTKKNHNN